MLRIIYNAAKTKFLLAPFSSFIFFPWLNGAKLVSVCLKYHYVASFSLLLQTVIDAYWKRLEDVKLGGPTYLAPVIQQIAAYAEREVSQCSQHYTIGLVIVDGIINDLESSTSTLIEVGNLALSIVVAGVGPADFRLMVRNVKVM